MIKIFFKTYCVCENKETAEKIANKMKCQINEFGEVSLFKIANYWKINDYFEISFEIESKIKIQVLSKELASNWEQHGESYIWNYKNECFLLSNKVRWASLEHIE